METFPDLVNKIGVIANISGEVKISLDFSLKINHADYLWPMKNYGFRAKGQAYKRKIQMLK